MAARSSSAIALSAASLADFVPAAIALFILSCILVARLSVLASAFARSASAFVIFALSLDRLSFVALSFGASLDHSYARSYSFLAISTRLSYALFCSSRSCLYNSTCFFGSVSFAIWSLNCPSFNSDCASASTASRLSCISSFSLCCNFCVCSIALAAPFNALSIFVPNPATNVPAFLISPAIVFEALTAKSVTELTAELTFAAQSSAPNVDRTFESARIGPVSTFIIIGIASLNASEITFGINRKASTIPPTNFNTVFAPLPKFLKNLGKLSVIVDTTSTNTLASQSNAFAIA